MSDGSSMYTGSFSRQAVRISRSISVAAFCGVSRACPAVTWAKAPRKRSQVPSPVVWCMPRPRSIDRSGIDPAMRTTGTCSAYDPAMPLIALSAPTALVTVTAPMPFSRA